MEMEPRSREFAISPTMFILVATISALLLVTLLALASSEWIIASLSASGAWILGFVCILFTPGAQIGEKGQRLYKQLQEKMTLPIFVGLAAGGITYAVFAFGRLFADAA